MTLVSVIVPTLNRAGLLAGCLGSLAGQNFPSSAFEVLVVDNGSTDGTAALSEQAMRRSGIANLRYLLEPEPGLLSGRHRGAIEAKGELLVFVDDDIEAAPGWLSALARAFDDPRVHLAGGPSVGRFAVTPPAWFTHFERRDPWGESCPALSLLHMGSERKLVAPHFVWGLNYAIRRQTLFDLGGFHPDCIPAHLQQYQGDGETGLSYKLAGQGHLCMYEPEALVQHCIPASRLTLEAFRKRFFYQGVCDSYTAIRSLGAVPAPPARDALATRSLAGHHGPDRAEPELVHIHQGYADGYLFHNAAVAASPALLEWVLRRDYFDYRLPRLESAAEGRP
jgi:glycosyltransferase involved in cell wall biosynthesis